MNEIANNIPPVAPGVFTLPPYDHDSPRLIGGSCPVCKRKYFPRPRYCRACLGPVEECDLGYEGTIYTFTVVRTKPPFGLPQPYSAGYIDLAGSGLRIYCLLDQAAIDQLRIGLPVRLAVGVMGHDGKGSPRLRPYFTPLTGE